MKELKILTHLQNYDHEVLTVEQYCVDKYTCCFNV